MKTTRYFTNLLLILLGVLFAIVGAAQPQQSADTQPSPNNPPKRILFVGNSYFYYNDSLHNHVLRMVTAADPASANSLQYKSATISGAPLAHHNIAHLLLPDGLGIKQPFDMVILQGASGEALSDAGRAAFRQQVLEMNKEIKKRGARSALYMTHAYVKPNKAANPDMIRKIEDMYVSVGKEAGSMVIPVGLAFEEAYRLRPDIKLHKEYDGSHPDLIGTYLAACVVYASLYGKSPVGNTYDYYGKIDKATAAFLQKVAEDTVRKFSSR